MRALVRFLLGALAAVFVIAGIAVAGVSFGADDAGYYTSTEYPLRTGSVGLTSDRFDLATNPGDWLPLGFATARLTVRSRDGGPVFVGIGPADSVASYLVGVAHDEVTGIAAGGAQLVVRTVAGAATVAPPASQGFWDLSATTSDQQTMTWDLKPGDWTVVIMNAGGGAGVDASVRFGVRLPGLLWVGLGMTALGVLLLVAALALRRRR